MPKLVRTIELYTCDFKCGTKAKEIDKMVNHEKTCFCNPENQSCRICQNCEPSQYEMGCKILKFHIVNLEKPHKVYDQEKNIVWEEKELPYDYVTISNSSEFMEVVEFNKTKPFPIKNCPHFLLGKKRF